MAYFDLSPGRPLLVVPDVHQNLDFFAAAVTRADSEGAGLCFLGDFIDGADARWREPAAMRAVARQIAELCEERPNDCAVLIGNHDYDALRVARFRQQLALQGDTKGIADLDAALPMAPHYAELLNLWPVQLLATWSIAAFAHDTLLSHAGVARRLWPWSSTGEPRAQAKTFITESNTVWLQWLEHDEEHALFAAGPGRGGLDAPVGGPLWLDWDIEFVDDLPFPQAVGHTRAKTVRRKDRSWCLDAGQTYVGLLDPDYGLRELRP